MKMTRQTSHRNLLTLTVIALSALVGIYSVEGAWHNSEAVLLEDVKVITLHQGHMTTGRRSAPVPQLVCVGGSGSHRFQPQTVRCENKGSDGYDVQWECKADMDNAYRFGKVEVICEGYDSPDDPYILKGSCGLEYTIELTEEGQQTEAAEQKKKNDVIGFIVMVIVAVFGFCSFCNKKKEYHGPKGTPTYSQVKPKQPNSASQSQHEPSAPPLYPEPSAPPPYPEPNAPPPYSETIHEPPKRQPSPVNIQHQQSAPSPVHHREPSPVHIHHHHHREPSPVHINHHHREPSPVQVHHHHHHATPSSSSPPAPQSSGTRTASGFGGTRRR